VTSFLAGAKIENISINTDTSFVFGEIQADYNNLIQNIKEYKILKQDDYQQNAINHLTKQINYNNQLANITKEQLKLMKKELVNAEAKFKTDSTLYAKKYTSKHEYYTNQTELNNKNN